MRAGTALQHADGAAPYSVSRKDHSKPRILGMSRLTRLDQCPSCPNRHIDFPPSQHKQRMTLFFKCENSRPARNWGF